MRTQWRLLLCVLFSCSVATACRREPAPLPPLVPQLSGTLSVPGLAAPVRIVRDTWGVPHIYAASQGDLFFAQGFVQAQDRLFQMDLWRRSALGRLSAALGPNFIERDAMTRRMAYRGDLAAEWASYGPDAKAIAEAFVRGVNAWVALARERPPEEFVLAGWKPDAWTAEDLLSRTDAFTASGDALDEVLRARLIAAAGLARARQLLPGDRAMEIPMGLDVALVPDLVAEAIRRVGTPPFLLGLAASVTEGTIRQNSETAATARTFSHPSSRYFVHLNAPGWNVIGATAPWHPGVAEGHNDRVASGRYNDEELARALAEDRAILDELIGSPNNDQAVVCLANSDAGDSGALPAQPFLTGEMVFFEERVKIGERNHQIGLAGVEPGADVNRVGRGYRRTATSGPPSRCRSG